jgi:hypothetical protein
MTQPIRLQLARRKGFDLQLWSRAVNGLPAVNCARPGKWGNPYRVGFPGIPDAAAAVSLFAATMPFAAAEMRRALRGKNLACWCASPSPCHVDILLKLANPPGGKQR